MYYMPAKILPDRTELEHMLRRGMTHQEIADKVFEMTGHRVRRATVSAAVHRANLSKPAKKYPNEIPWRVNEEHLMHYAARMLRLLGRRNAGIRNSTEMDQRLDAWLEQLHQAHAVVAYIPNTSEGFFYVEGTPTEAGIPIVENYQP